MIPQADSLFKEGKWQQDGIIKHCIYMHFNTNWLLVDLLKGLTQDQKYWNKE